MYRLCYTTGGIRLGISNVDISLYGALNGGILVTEYGLYFNGELLERDEFIIKCVRSFKRGELTVDDFLRAGLDTDMTLLIVGMADYEVAITEEDWGFDISDM